MDWSAYVDQQEVIPSTPYRPEMEAKMKEIIQEAELNGVCNEAYDELLTHEFNPDQEDFEVDVVRSEDVSTTTNQTLALVSTDIGMH